jgi:hypothetical protein
LQTAACLICLEPALHARAQATPTTNSPAASTPAASTPAASAADARAPERAAFAPVAGDHAFRASGLIQVDAVPYSQSSLDQLDPGSGRPLNRDAFSIPRAWLTGEGRVGYVRGLVQLQGSTGPEPSFRLLAAELSVGYPKAADTPYVEGALGLFLIPFGIETQDIAPRRMFLEPSTWVGALFPGRRDLGARVTGSVAFVTYQLAVMNGNPSAASAFPLADPNRAKDVVGRIASFGELAPHVRLELGGSGLWGRGFHPGALPTKDTLVARDVNEDGIVQTSEIQIVSGNPGEPSRNFQRYALGADAALDYALPLLGAGRLYGELGWAKNLDRALFVADPVAQARPVRELGTMLAVRQMLSRHAELGLRYDRYDGDLDASERRGLAIAPYDAVVSTWSVALAFCTLPRLRITAQYDHSKNPFGRSASGASSTLAADVLTLRAQLEI